MLLERTTVSKLKHYQDVYINMVHVRKILQAYNEQQMHTWGKQIEIPPRIADRKSVV